MSDPVEAYKKEIQEQIIQLRDVFAHAAVGDFSKNVTLPDTDSQLEEVFVGVQVILEVIREKIRKLEEEVKIRKQKEEALTKLIAREVEIEKMKDQFVSMASHELRTPLTGIRGALSMMFEGSFGEVPEHLKGPLSDVFKATDRLQHMTDDILSISRLETGEMKFTAEPVELKAIIEEVIHDIHPILEEKKLELSVDVNENIYVLADTMKLRQICMNLIGNALKFTDTGSISIRASENGYYIDIFFKDTGIGIEESEKTKLFQKFSQLSNKSTRPAGSGLGLYISKEFAKKMGGDLTLTYSEPGSGSEFLLSLPSVGH